MENAFDDLLNVPGPVGDVARESAAFPPTALETPSDTAQRYAQVAQQQARIQRVRAGDLAARGIPSTVDSSGQVQPVRDESGAALTGYDSRHKTAWDSLGTPKTISYGETGGPIVQDALTGTPNTTDPKTGDQYEVKPGLPWSWTGVDPEVAADAQARQDAKQRTETASALGQLASLQGGKVSLDQHQAVAAAKTMHAIGKSLNRQGIGDGPLYDETEKTPLVDRDTALQQADQFFNSQYATPEANRKTAFGFGSDLTPEAQTMRQQIDGAKAATFAKIQKLYDAHDQLNASQGNIDTQQAQIAAVNAQRLALAQQRVAGIPGLEQLAQSPPSDGAAPPVAPGAENLGAATPNPKNVAASLPAPAQQVTEPPKVDASGAVQPEGFWATVGREFGTKIIPAAATAAGGIAGGALGGAAGLETGPGALATALAGDIAGGALAGTAADKAQRAVMGDQWAAENDAQRQANAQAHPVASQIGSMVPFLISLLGGGGALVKAGDKVIGKAVTSAGKSAIEEALAKGATYEAPLVERLATHAAMGARAGASEGAQQKYAEGNEDASVIDSAAKGAVQFGATGLFPPAKALLTQIFGKAVTDAAAMTFAGALYDTAIHGKPFDLEDTAKEFAGDVPAFVIQNAILGFLSHGMAAMNKPGAGMQVGGAGVNELQPDVAEELRNLRKTDPEKFKQRFAEEVAKRAQGEYPAQPQTAAEKLNVIDIRLAQMRRNGGGSAQEEAALQSARDAITAQINKAQTAETPPAAPVPTEAAAPTDRASQIAAVEQQIAQAKAVGTDASAAEAVLAELKRQQAAGTTAPVIPGVEPATPERAPSSGAVANPTSAAGVPAAPEGATPPAGSQVVSGASASVVSANQRVLADVAEKSGVADKIEALAAEKWNADQIAQKLGIEPDMVRAVRASRGIPSPTGGGLTKSGAIQDTSPEFGAWLAARASTAPVESTPSVAPVEAVPGSTIAQAPSGEIPSSPSLPQPAGSSEPLSGTATGEHQVQSSAQPATTTAPAQGDWRTTGPLSAAEEAAHAKMSGVDALPAAAARQWAALDARKQQFGTDAAPVTQNAGQPSAPGGAAAVPAPTASIENASGLKVGDVLPESSFAEYERLTKKSSLTAEEKSILEQVQNDPRAIAAKLPIGSVIQSVEAVGGERYIKNASGDWISSEGKQLSLSTQGTLLRGGTITKIGSVQNSNAPSTPPSQHQGSTPSEDGKPPASNAKAGETAGAQVPAVDAAVGQVKKTVKAALALHHQELDALGHPREVTFGETRGQSGIETDVTSKRIVVDPQKVAGHTGKMTKAQALEWVKRSIAHEVIHLGTLRYAEESPENRENLMGLTQDTDLMSRAGDAYGPEWDGLNDFAKAAEAARMLIEGPEKLTEASYKFLADFLKWLKAKLKNLSKDTRALIEGIEAKLGRHRAEAKKETKPGKKPSVPAKKAETKPATVEPSKPELTETQQDIKDAFGDFLAAAKPVSQTETPEFKRWFGKDGVRGKDGNPIIVHHGNETGPIERIDRPIFLTTSKREAEAYSEITDVDAIHNAKEVDPSKSPQPVPESFHMMDAWPVADDFEGPKNTLQVEDGTGSIFYWTGETNGVGDKDFVYLKGIRANPDTGKVEPFDHEDRSSGVPDTHKPFVGSYFIRGKFFDAGDSRFTAPGAPGPANVIGRRLGGSDKVVDEWRKFLASRGYTGIQTFSDDAPSVRQYVVFNPSDIKSATSNSGAFDPQNPSILAAATPESGYDNALPSDKLPAIIGLAQKLVAKGVKTPETLAKDLQAIGPKAVGISQKLWQIIHGFGGEGDLQPEWPAVYRKLSAPSPTPDIPSSDEATPGSAEKLANQKTEAESGTNGNASAVESEGEASDDTPDFTPSETSVHALQNETKTWLAKLGKSRSGANYEQDIEDKRKAQFGDARTKFSQDLAPGDTINYGGKGRTVSAIDESTGVPRVEFSDGSKVAFAEGREFALVEPPKVEAAPKERKAAEKLANAPDTLPAKLKVQKAYLLDALEKAISDAAVDRTPDFATKVGAADAKTVADFGRYDSPIQKEKPRAVQSWESDEIKADYADKLKAWEFKAAEQLQPLLDQYGIPSTKEPELGYTGQDGTQQLASDGGPLPLNERIELLSTAIRELDAISHPRIEIEVPGDGNFRIINTKEALTKFRDEAKKQFPTRGPQPDRLATNQRTTPTAIPPLGKPKGAGDLIRTAGIASWSDTTRYVLNFVMSDGKNIVGTDGRRMLIISGKAGGTESEPVLFSPKTLAISKEEIYFPNWKQVVPADTKFTEKAVDTASLMKLVTQASLMASERSNSVALWRDSSGKLGVTSSTPDAGMYAGGEVDPQTAKLMAAVNPDMFNDGLRAARMLGHEKVDLHWTDGREALVLEAPGFKYVLMPMRTSSEDDTGVSGLHPLYEKPAVAPKITSTSSAPKQVTAALSAPVEKAGIQDFGEKLGGARKDIAASMKREISDDEIARLPLSDIWPKSEVDAIEDIPLAALATAVRAEIPAKPRQSYKVKQWAEKVKTVRGLMRIAGEHGYDAVMAKMGEYRLEQLANKIRLLQTVPREQWGRIGRVWDHPDAYQYKRDADGKQVFENGQMVKVPSPTSGADVDDRSITATNLSELSDKVNAKLAGDAPEERMKFEVRGRGDHWFINKKGDPLYRKLQNFSDSKTAVEFARNPDNYSTLTAAWDAVKQSDNVKETDVRRETNQDRSGKDWRNGKDATPEMFMDSFGFRGAEFGNWVSQGKNIKERQGMLNAAFDALHDLADLVGVPPKAISLNGTLGLGFGSRGHGWASAHFEPGNLVINLTKTRGAGSLAHEWFHALDNYFQRKRNERGIAKRHGDYITNNPETYYEGPTGQRLSEARYKELSERPYNADRLKDWKRVEGVRPQVAEAFMELVKALDASPMAKRAELIDKGKSDGYWSRVIERAARSFENYVIAKMQLSGESNDYLANVVRVEEFARDQGRYPYLLPDELAPVSQAFDNLFSTFETKETDKGVALHAATPRSKSVESAIRPAYDALVQKTGFPAVSIGALAKESGVPLDVVRAQMLDLHRQGKAVLSTGDWSLSDPETKAGAVEVNGTKMLQVRLLPESAGTSNLAADVQKNIRDAKMMSPADPAGFLRRMISTAKRQGKDASAFEEALAAMPQALGAATPIPQTETPEFKRWFGESKITDAKGDPRVMSHGTHRDFEVFDRLAGRIGNSTKRLNGQDEVGHWFTDGPESARIYGAKSVQAYLRIEKPFMIYGEGKSQFAKFSQILEKSGGADQLRARLSKMGYDGIVMPDVMLDRVKQTVAVAFEPDQIKSATGNSGAFNPNNPSILAAATPFATVKTPEQNARDSAEAAAKGPKANGNAVAESAKSVKESVQRTVDQAVQASKTISGKVADFFTKLPEVSSYKFAKGMWLGAGHHGIPGRQFAAHEARMMKRSIEKKFSRPSLEAISRYLEVGGDRGQLLAQAAASKPNVRPVYEHAADLNPAEIEMAETARRYFDEVGQKAQEVGLLRDLLENYVTHFVDRSSLSPEKKISALNQLNGVIATSKLKTKFDHALRRVFATMFDLEQKGYRLQTSSVADAMAAYGQAFSNTLADRTFIKQLTKQKASDGRPLVATSGYAKPVGDEEDAPEAVMVKPHAKPSVKVLDTEGEAQAVDTQDYKLIDHPALRKWKLAGKDTAGNPIYVQGDLLVHPEIYEDLRNTLGTSALNRYAALRALTGAQYTIKQTMMALSFFHVIQEGTHAIGHTINPFRLTKIDFDDPIQRKLVNAGLMVSAYDAKRDFAEGLASSGLISKLPWLGKMNDEMTGWLFEDFIPRLKMTMGVHAFERNLQRFAKELADGKITRAQVAQKTARQANDAFGEQNNKYEGNNPTRLHAERLFALAPDFLKSRAKFFADAFTKYGGEQRRAIVILAVAMLLTAKLIERMLTGENHWDKPFSVVYGNRQIELRSVPGDFLELVQDPRRFVNGRLSPLISRTTLEAVTGRDWRGMKRTPLEQVKDGLSQAVPISLQGVVNPKDIPWTGQVINALGARVKRYSEISEARKFGHQWQIKEGIENPSEAFPPSKYLPARQALEDGDQAAAAKAISKLVAAEGYEKALRGFHQSIMKPMSGSVATELRFERSLTPDQLAIVKHARQQQQRILSSFASIAATSPRPMANRPMYAGFN